jgi:diguanylate cyclase (GGDEF)-like protein/PAS domain S-box-containing protein
MRDHGRRGGGAMDLVGLGALVAQSSLGYLTMTADGRILSHNAGAQAILGHDESPTGQALLELLVPADRTTLMHLLAGASGGRAVTDVTLRIRRAGRAPARVLTSMTRVVSPDGAVSHLAAILQDDTARQEASESLSRQFNRAATLLRALPDAVLICGADGVILEANDQAEALFGYAVEELVGQPIEVLVPEQAVSAHRWHRERYSATAHSRPMITGPDISARRKGGELVPVEVNLAAAALESGPVVVAAVRDVTESRAQATQLRDSLHLVSSILSAATEQAIIAVDLQGRVESFSRGAERLLGYTAAEMAGRPASILDAGESETLANVWGLDDRDPLHERVEALVRSGVSTTRPWTWVTKAGELRSILLSVTVRSTQHGPGGLILVATDQSERMAKEAALRASEERFRRTFESIPVGAALISLAPDLLGRFLQVNPALQEFIGYGTDELLDATLPDLTHPEDLPLMVATLDRLAMGEPVAELVETRYLHADGRRLWGQASLAAVHRGDADRGTYVVATIVDVTARKQAEAELTHHALHDTLTGLPNRALLTEQLTQALGRAKRSGRSVGVLYIDLDNFKDVNDSLGHGAGDELLTEIGNRLASCMRDSDLAGRLGGDEFVVVCEDLDSVDDITSIADRVAAALSVQVPLAGQMVATSASIGIAHTSDAGANPEDLLREADVAMYRAKTNGRGRYEFADPSLQARALRQIELEADLRATLAAQHDPASVAPAPTVVSALVRRPEEGRLFLDYQPCFDSRTGTLVACEALLRWDHPSRGRLAPGQFLDVAEDRALMAPLGAWVLEEAARQAADWARRFVERAPEMWVNVSARQMGSTRFSGRVAEVLADTGLPASLLCLELTERQALSSAPLVLEDLQALQEMGVRLAIDDFGTGYAGLDYLRRLPVSALKVDASYVAAIGTDPTGTALVASVVNLGHAMDLTVVAEGVETEEQRSVVTELGADVLQGYLLGRPGQVDDVERILARQRVG